MLKVKKTRIQRAEETPQALGVEMLFFYAEANWDLAWKTLIQYDKNIF